MSDPDQAGSARRDVLLERCYRYVLTHGLSGISLRPLATAVGSSPRVLLFLFGSKDELVATLLARAREDELALLGTLPEHGGLEATARVIWSWLSDPEHRGLLRLWVDSYARGLTAGEGPWSGFARATVEDWLAVLARAQPAAERRTARGAARRTAALALLRGGLLDLLATGDEARVRSAIAAALAKA